MHVSMLYLYFVFLHFFCATADITTSKFLRDPQTLISNNTNFKVGFFSPINSTNRYLGIWYNIQNSDNSEVIWVANRDNPLNDTSGVLKVSKSGSLQLLNAKNKVFWSSNSNITPTFDQVTNPVAKILDTGNLVLLASNINEKIIWQSFDHPVNSLLPPVKVVMYDDSRNWKPLFRSWNSPSDPSSGRFTTGIKQGNLTELVTWEGDKPYWRSGPWNGNIILGVPFISMASLNGFSCSDVPEHTFCMTYSMVNETLQEHMKLNYDGNLLIKVLDDKTRKWAVKWGSVESECDVYGKCGPFGSCNSKNSPICECLRGFEPKAIEEWSEGNWSSGCVRTTPLECLMNNSSSSDGFMKLQHMKVPDNAEWLTVQEDYEDECEKKCLASCSCSAYAFYSGIGCMHWNDTLIDLQQFTIFGVDLFIRVAASELGEARKWKLIIVAPVAVGAAAITAIIMYFLWRWMNQKHAGKNLKITKQETLLHSITEAGGSGIEFQDLPLFKFEKLIVATNNFQQNNKLGQGGFGPVYKGELENGQEIAVKRLSRTSGQGMQEFMNEVIVISKLQHRNLVKLLGCCIEGEEKLLVYEFMQNKSLDALLFDHVHQKILDWKKRFVIIKGICRGILYLHRDSRLKIIHRDLKPSNILLDEEFNPKISDFGMARIFGGKQDQANTVRVVGTYGYMSPEYAMEGKFSEKSDVFSLGVLLLEIVSGQRNGSIHEESSSLITYAWKLWNEDNVLPLVDPTISDPCFKDEILRSIHVGLLCLQEFPKDRPSISTAILMLDSEIIDLPQPQQPGFTQSRFWFGNEVQQSFQQYCSLNQVSISHIDGR